MASKTEAVYLTGKVKWCKTMKPDKWGKWKVTLYPDTESYNKIVAMKEAGLKNHLKKDDEGYYMTFSRPTEREYMGKKKGLVPPAVLQADGKTPLVGLVGNGSDCTIKLEYYSWDNKTLGTKGVGARFESVRVNDLVPYEATRDFDEEEQANVKGLAEQPAPLF